MILLNELLQVTLDSPDATRVADFFIRFAFNFITVFILIRYIFYPNNGQKELILTYMILGLVVFLIATALSHVKMDFALAIGLFAVFSIIRYRTPPFEIKEMTYLFAVIGISVINALVESKITEWLAFAIADVLLLGTAVLMEHYKPSKNINKNLFTFVPSGLHILDDKKRMIEEIKKQTELNVFKVEISRINAVKNEVTVWIYFK